MPSVTLRLPAQFDGGNMCRFAQGFVEACPDGMPDEVIISFATLEFIRPVGVTFLSNFVRWLFSKGVQVKFAGHTTMTHALRYLDDSLFFEQHAGQKLSQHSSPRATTQPLVSVHHDQSYPWLRNGLVPWLAGRLRPTLAPLHTSMQEIFNNIQDHSSIEIGSIFVQHYPAEKRVQIAIADFGCSIPASVQRLIPTLDDVGSIQKAVEAGFTTQSTKGNKGAGLDYLLSTLVRENGGRVEIFSRNGHVLFYNVCNEVRSHAYRSGFCPGTTIDIGFRTDTIIEVHEEQEDLEW